MNGKQILLIEDETDVMLSNQEYLSMKGYQIITAETLAEADRILSSTIPDLILLDVLLPDGNGFEYIKKIREHYFIPVIFLTCLSETDDVVKGLLSGGCDYITKPYNFEELYARTLAHIRAREELNGREKQLSAGNITLNMENNRAYVNGEDAGLKPLEFYLLAYLVRNPDRVIPGEELYLAVWGRSSNGDTRTVRVHVHELRKKLNMPKDDYGETLPYLETVFGRGYCFRTAC